MIGDQWMDIRSDYNKGMSLTDIGKKYGIDPRTAKKYATVNEKPMYPKDTTRPTKIDPYKELIDELLAEAPYSAVRIQEIITEHGFDGKYTIVKEYVRGRKKDLNKQATVRFETMPGLQGQVDWAHFPNHRVTVDGREHKLYCFLMILGYSRMRYIEFVTDMSTDTLIRCYINAFRYFGGYPDELDHILSNEARSKKLKSTNTRIQMAGFPFRKSLEDFDFEFQPSINKEQIMDLATMRFAHNQENVVFLGPPGVGKTHLVQRILNKW